MRKAYLTKPLQAERDKLEATRESFVARIYACGNHDDPFSECKRKSKTVDPDLAWQYDAACSDLFKFEDRMIHEGRAWRSKTGGIYYNTK